MDVEKLLAAIEETERKALAVPEHLRVESWTHPGPWVMHGVESRSEDEVALVRMTGRQAEAIAGHIAHNDPAAVLRRCAQDRLMVEAVQRHIKGHPGEHTNEGDPYDSCELCVEWNANALPESVLDYLARGYGISVEEETTGES